MPRIIGNKNGSLVVDEKKKLVSEIKASKLLTSDLEEQLVVGLSTKEVIDGEWKLFIHISNIKTASVAMLITRKNIKVLKDWWKD